MTGKSSGVGFRGVTLVPSRDLDFSTSNPGDTIYIKGDADTDHSWRFTIVDPPDKMSVQHREPLNETITLDDAKVTAIEASDYTDENPYYGGVATDSRSNQSLPGGISGDQTGKVVNYNGSVWMSYADQWIEKGNFQLSFFSDRGVFQRANIIDTDPDNPVAFPAAPEEGVTIGSRNTLSSGMGVEVLSSTTKEGIVSVFPVMIHGGPATPNDLGVIKVDGTIVSVPYELGWFPGLNWNVGDRCVVTGTRYTCNTAGVQTGFFTDNLDKWDEVLVSSNLDFVLTDDGDVLTETGNVLLEPAA